MSAQTPRHDITKKRVVYQLPRTEEVTVRRALEYRLADGDTLTTDLYYPPGSKDGARRPAVVFVNGYPDPGLQKIFGCKMNEMESYISWGQLAAASGLVAITYTTGKEPAADVLALLQYVRQNATDLGIDENRIGLWACSGNVPNALSVLMQVDRGHLKCAVSCYGLMLDLDGATSVADAARQWGFANPCAGRSVADLPRDEMPNLNGTMDRFLSEALRSNLPITFVNHPAAPHAFDLMHDSETSREIIRQILAFMRFHLLAEAGVRRSNGQNP
jgi:hypothetical protein